MRLDRQAGAERVGSNRRWNLRLLRRDSRDGGQPYGRHGAAGLSRLALEVYSRYPHRLHSRLSHAARQYDRNAALFAAVVVPCDYIPRIQEVQASVYHVIRENLEWIGHGTA